MRIDFWFKFSMCVSGYTYFKIYIMASLVVTMRVANSLFGGNTFQIVCFKFINVSTYLKGGIKNVREREEGSILHSCATDCYCFWGAREHMAIVITYGRGRVQPTAQSFYSSKQSFSLSDPSVKTGTWRICDVLQWWNLVFFYFLCNSCSDIWLLTF